MSTRTGNGAIAWAKRQITAPSRDWSGLCLAFTRSCFGVTARDASAIIGWGKAKNRHGTSDADSIPAGVPVWWQVGRYGHVAISLGGGKCISTDILRRGKPDVVDIDTITRRWGAKLLGWTEDINGIRVYTAPKPAAKPALRYGVRNSAKVKALQKALNAHKMKGGHNLPITGNYLDQTDAEVRLCQRLHGYGTDKAGKSYVGPRQAKHLGLD